MLSERQRRKIRRALREMLQALDVPPIRYTGGKVLATANAARWVASRSWYRASCPF
jgi:alpha-L-arabinofuranosidase